MQGRKIAKRLLKTIRPGRNQKKLDPTSKLVISNEAGLVRGSIVMGAGSSLVVEAGAIIDTDITIGENCNVVLGKNSRLVRTSFLVMNGSRVSIGEGAIIDSPVQPRSSIFVDNGRLRLERRAHVMSTELLVRFGGKLSIGEYTGIAYGSEIRCEQQVDIGSYGMISYRVCIYDTNTHSTDWHERRKRIEHCYPEGVNEETKPSTSPVSIGDDVWIGQEVTITKGAQIGNRCIIGIRTTLGSGSIDDDSVIVSAKPRIISRRDALSESQNQTVDLNV
jgi:acetyltransferase-like isoleucine patch superfamily enzyme